MNLLQETIETLAEHNLTLADVVWFGTASVAVNGNIEAFLNVDYTDCNDEIPMELVLVGTNWWLEREYDSSGELIEYWEFRQCPTKPDCSVVSPRRSTISMTTFIKILDDPEHCL